MASGAGPRRPEKPGIGDVGLVRRGISLVSCWRRRFVAGPLGSPAAAAAGPNPSPSPGPRFRGTGPGRAHHADRQTRTPSQDRDSGGVRLKSDPIGPAEPAWPVFGPGNVRCPPAGRGGGAGPGALAAPWPLAWLPPGY